MFPFRSQESIISEGMFEIEMGLPPKGVKGVKDFKIQTISVRRVFVSHDSSDDESFGFSGTLVARWHLNLHLKTLHYCSSLLIVLQLTGCLPQLT